MGTCETCRWRSEQPYLNPDRGTAEFSDIMFACKLRAPVVTGGLHCPTMTVWPVIKKTDFCGEHSSKPQPCPHGFAEIDCEICRPF